MSVDLFLYVAALICMVLAAFGVPARVNLYYLSLACLIATLVF